MSLTADQANSGATPDDVTGLLLAWSAGNDPAAAEQLLAAVYTDLHAQAERAMRREGDEHTLQATELVHEAYMRLVDQRRVQWQNRSHFFGIAAQAMRRVLVDHARARLAAKRGGAMQQVTLGGVHAADDDADGLDVLALHEALERLAALDADQARLVELRYFGGLNIDETATALGISPATVKREWAVARAWLRRELTTP
jgi:RNA polymerase sigma-70 factor (ECF subfamily)